MRTPGVAWVAWVQPTPRRGNVSSDTFIAERGNDPPNPRDPRMCASQRSAVRVSLLVTFCGARPGARPLRVIFSTFLTTRLAQHWGGEFLSEAKRIKRKPELSVIASNSEEHS